MYRKSLAILLLLIAFTPFLGAKVKNKQTLIGSKAADWQVDDWINSKPLQLKEMKGKVVLVRWWTAGCPFCVATAPSLKNFYQQYHKQGLEVVGFYHHKSDTNLDIKEVKRYSDKFGFAFPVAIDYQWKTLKHWWLDRSDQDWTSVSFLIDKKGIIKHIHPGGKYVKGDKDYTLMQQKIEELLAEK